MSKDARILIVGGGPSGLALALTLLRNGVSVRIIEKHPKFQVGARGCGLQPRTLELYKFLGILPDVMKASGFVPALVKYSSPEGDTPPKVITPPNLIVEDTPSRPYHNARILGQDFHEEIFRRHIWNDYNCQVELATELRSFEQNSDHVIAHLAKTNAGEDGVEEVTETATFDWLIGADGARSLVRKHLGLSFFGEEPSAPAAAMVVGDIHVKKGLNPEVRTFWGSMTEKACIMRMYEIPGDDRCSFFLGGSEVDVEKVVSSRDELIKSIYEISGRNELEFGELIRMNIWRPNVRMVNKLDEGRVFVTGDAAHVHPPTGGQGLNSGVQDSINLGWKLSLVQKRLASKDVLDTYTQERLPVIASMLNKTTAFFKRSWVTGNDTEKGWARDDEFRQLGVNYRGSPLVIDEKHPLKDGEAFDPYRAGEDGTLRAGDRAPDAPSLVQLTGDGEPTVTSLFDTFKSHCHTVLVFSHPRKNDINNEMAQVLASYPKGTVQSAFIFPQSTAAGTVPVEELGNLTVLDREGYAYQHYGITEEGAIVIVRPDGYIGALVGGLEGVKAYFGRIFL